jgi:gliding motility-associated-like protein
MKTAIIFLLLLTGVCNLAHADHIIGGELSYKYISSSGENHTYKLTLSFLADCRSGGGINALKIAKPKVSIYKGTELVSLKLLVIDTTLSGIEITPVCPDEASQTTCSGINNSIPGIKQYVYTSDVVLPGRSDDWRFAFRGDNNLSSAARSTIIQNANVEGGMALMYLEATLNNTAGNNNSIYFTSLPSPFFCINKEQTYNPGAVDPDTTDKLLFRLIPAQKPTNATGPGGNPLSYHTPYTAESPLPTAPGNFNFDSISGQLNFLPNQAVNSLVVTLVEEFRNGVRVGSTMREITFVMLTNCNNDYPRESIENVTNATTVSEHGNPVIVVCSGKKSTFSFDIKSTDPNGDNVTVSYTQLPPGAEISIVNNGTMAPVVTFTWNASGMPEGDYVFYVTFTDDGCPLRSVKTQAYTVRVAPYDGIFDLGISPPCNGENNGTAWIHPSINHGEVFKYQWTDVHGNILRDYSSNMGDTLQKMSLGIYYVNIISSDGCKKTMEVNMKDPMPLPEIMLPNDTTLCEGLPFDISISPKEFEVYRWNTGAAGCCITVDRPGTYLITAANKCGTAQDGIDIGYVKCNFCLFVPNAFSPNGDGNNDVFRLLQTCLMDKYKLQIFNRWGQPVFTSLSISNSWDGTYKGSPAEVGNYFYFIEATPRDKSKGIINIKGDLLLVR